MNLVFCTSFGKSYYDKVAKYTLPALVKATQHYHLMVYYEDELLLYPKINHPHVDYLNLFHASPDCVEYLMSIKDDKMAQGLVYSKCHDHLWTEEQKKCGYNYCLNAYTFPRKWFALQCAMNRAMCQYEDFILCWIDADVLMHNHLTGIEDHLNTLFDDMHTKIVYLKRNWVHSECGLMFFKSSDASQLLIDRICSDYSTHFVFNYDEWHDSYVFDINTQYYYDSHMKPMATGGYGEDVFSKCFFAEYATHLKGCNKAKMKEIFDEAG